MTKDEKAFIAWWKNKKDVLRTFDARTIARVAFYAGEEHQLLLTKAMLEEIKEKCSCKQ